MRRGRPGFVGLFPGSGRLALTTAAITSLWAEAWDVENGEQFDLTIDENLARLWRAVRAGLYWMVHMGPPCATRSKARAPPLRSLDYLLGSLN